MYELRGHVKIVVLMMALAVACVRLFTAIDGWQLGDYTGIQSYSFCVVVPATLLVLLTLMAGTRSREGALMRFGSIIHLLLVLSLPPFSLHIALGFPVVFFAVEVFSTRLPKRIALPVERAIIA